jgi:tetratricopeptide (TPR) repeat protein
VKADIILPIAEAKGDKMRYFVKVFIFAVLNIFLFAGLSHAKVVTFEKEYTYQASEIDSKATSRAIAVEQVKRLVLEELGTYLLAETEVKDFRLTKDKIVMLTAGIVQTEILNEKWDGEKYYLKARVKADPNEVAAAVDKLRKDTQKTKELEDVKKKADEALKEIERLKKELETVKADKNKQKKYAKKADILSAKDWFEKGYQYAMNEEYDKAIEAYTSAIALDPNYAFAYDGRGLAYMNKGQYDRAIEDYNKAIALHPNDVFAYTNRGRAYMGLGTYLHYQQAIEDFSKAIELMPNIAETYSVRGFAYKTLGNHQQAIKDINKAIELKPDIADAYYERGLAYGVLGNIQQSIADFKIAARLGNEGAQDFLRKQGEQW